MNKHENYHYFKSMTGRLLEKVCLKFYSSVVLTFAHKNCLSLKILFILSVSPPIFNYDNYCCLVVWNSTVLLFTIRQNTLHLIMNSKMKYFVTSVPTWTRVSQKPMDCMIKVNQKHLLPLIPLVVGERIKRVSWHSLIFICRNESPAFWCCHIHENRVSLPLLRKTKSKTNLPCPKYVA